MELVCIATIMVVLFITLCPTPLEYHPRLCDSAFQIQVEGDYRDVDRFSAHLLPSSNEVIVLLPSIPAKWFDARTYAQMIPSPSITSSGVEDFGHTQFLNSESIMR